MQIFADEYPDQLKLAFESGNPPDMFNMNQPRQQAEAGWASRSMPTSMPPRACWNRSFRARSVENQGMYDGEIHGLPMYAQTMRLYYNKRLFEAGRARPGCAAQDLDRDAHGRQGHHRCRHRRLWLHLRRQVPVGVGHERASPGRRRGRLPLRLVRERRITYNLDGFKQAMEIIIGMNDDGGLFPGVHTLTDDDARQQFSIGMAGMIIGGSWNPGVFNDQFASTEDWETAELPMPDGGQAGPHPPVHW